jgi:hypothetical protein
MESKTSNETLRHCEPSAKQSHSLKQSISAAFPEVKVNTLRENEVKFNTPELTESDFAKLAGICGHHHVRPTIRRSGTGICVALANFKIANQ